MIQPRTPIPMSPPASTRVMTSVTHLADAVARRVRTGLTADQVEVDDGGGTKETGSCNACLRTQAQPKLAAAPKTTPDASAVTRAQPTPNVLVVTANAPTTTSTMPVISIAILARSELARGRLSFVDLGCGTGCMGPRIYAFDPSIRPTLERVNRV